jgi:hypothetical protein
MKKYVKFFIIIIIIILFLAIYINILNPDYFKRNTRNDPIVINIPYSTLLEMDGKTNFEVTTTNGPANEVTIAVNPKNPNNLIAGAKDYTLGPSGSGYIVWSGYYWSTDGGKTWGNNLMGYPNIDDSILGVYDAISDPVVGFDGQGNAYYSGLMYKSRSEFVPDLPRPWIANNGIYMVFHDKQWFAIDPDNGYIYVTWTRYQGVQGRMVFARSTDGGLTWDRPKDISRTFEIARQTSGSVPVVGPDGTIYVTWIDYMTRSLMFSVSTDHGQTWPTFAEPIVSVVPLPGNIEENEYRTPTLPSMAVDCSNSNTSGNLYVVWNDYRNGNSDILLIKSENSGNSWSEPKRVNDDPENSTADQYFPFIDVSPSGDIHIVFYDKRDDPEHYLLNLYYTHSRDGHNFDENWRISTNSSDPAYSYHQNGNVFIGDYIGIDSSENYAYPIWTDTRNSEADAFTAVIVGEQKEKLE